MYSVFGVDGNGETDDGAQITSNSYGESDIDNDEWDNRSRLISQTSTLKLCPNIVRVCGAPLLSPSRWRWRRSLIWRNLGTRWS